uniref:Beta-ig-h3 fasciclin n=1 Tax=Tetraselmis sp. GSL018 TaxID=582737 RepID=A0A061R2Y8_9CHLO
MGALGGEGSFTVFAPTDGAFEALLGALEVTAEELLARDDLADVLRYHVAAGMITSADLFDGQMIPTLLPGRNLTVSIPHGGPAIAIAGAAVSMADIRATNGVVHVVGSVLIPPPLQPSAFELVTPTEEPPAETFAAALPATVVDIAAGYSTFSTLVVALEASNLMSMLRGEGPFTVFAPTDGAFVALLEALGATAEELLARDNLADILRYHMAAGMVTGADLAEGLQIATLQGESLPVGFSQGLAVVGGANVVQADMEASNGVVHAVDSVLLPSSVRPPTVVDVLASNGFTILVEALSSVGLMSELVGRGPFTVFAPPDSVLNDFLAAIGTTVQFLDRDILRHHVTRGRVTTRGLTNGRRIGTLGWRTLPILAYQETRMVSGASITQADLEASNGVVHVVDSVLFPYSSPVPSTLSAVFEVLSGNGFVFLVEAALFAERRDRLSTNITGDGPLTVFAPTNAAFVALLRALGTDANVFFARNDLVGILLHHMAAGQAGIADLEHGREIETIRGTRLPVAVARDGSVSIRGARVKVAGMQAGDSMVHVVDSVLLPPYETVVDALVSNGFAELMEALGATNLTAALIGDGPWTIFALTDSKMRSLQEKLNSTGDDGLASSNLTEILGYHLVRGRVTTGDLASGQQIETMQGLILPTSVSPDGSATVGGARIRLANLHARNGVVHVVDSALLPRSGSLVDILVSNGLTTFKAAIDSAGLTGTLSSDGPLTMFAPTNAAFESLFEELGVSAESYLARWDLIYIVRYHLVSSQIMGKELLEQTSIQNLQRAELPAAVSSGGSLTIGGARVTRLDIQASNGVVHIIDSVLRPRVKTRTEDSLTGRSDRPDEADVSAGGGSIISFTADLTGLACAVLAIAVCVTVG